MFFFLFSFASTILLSMTFGTCQPPFLEGEFNHVRKNELTSNSSILVFHFSKLILLIAQNWFLGMHKALWTTAVAPIPKNISKFVSYFYKCLLISLYKLEYITSDKRFWKFFIRLSILRYTFLFAKFSWYLQKFYFWQFINFF